MKVCLPLSKARTNDPERKCSGEVGINAIEIMTHQPLELKLNVQAKLRRKSWLVRIFLFWQHCQTAGNSLEPSLPSGYSNVSVGEVIPLRMVKM
jgi:hypothetical protein